MWALLNLHLCKGAFQRFTDSNKSTPGTIFDYFSWHSQEMEKIRRSKGACQKENAKPATILFVPSAGLGDDALRLAETFTTAMRTGRMLFVNWTVESGSGIVELKDLLEQPFFEWDWQRAKSALCNPDNVVCRFQFDGDSTLRAERKQAKARANTETFLSKLPSEAVVLQHLLRPGGAVKQHYERTLSLLQGHFVVSSVIRTGML
jgi:hypothetical protein